ncbi:MAG: GtrA family protein [Bacilli bacterium]|nr:GtrA family protein [Bacilli bacterium]MDD4623885.1 GtrA family protein [Bacilli bacterium]MDD4831560.1 GtrA family protein [Bacilli bacterium]
MLKEITNKYNIFIKYTLSAGFCFALDQILFYIFRLMMINSIGDTSIFIGAFLARVISSFVNYLINRDVVFGAKNKQNTLYKYYALVIIQLGISTLSVYIIYKLTNIDTSIIKIVVDIIIFIINYFIQRKYIFKNKE